MSRIFGSGGVLLIFSLIAACSSGGDDADGTGNGSEKLGNCETVVEKLVQCELVEKSDGPTGCEERLITDCLTECIVGADCTSLESAYCSDAPDTSLLACLRRCEVPEIACGDGVGTYTPAELCDGVVDCDNGADETNCTFTCNDGTTIPNGFQCDGLYHCPDGEDEADCLFVNCPPDPPIPDNPYEHCEAFMRAFDECGMIGEGLPYCSPQITECYANCYTNASCDEIVEAHCTDANETSLITCLRSCPSTFSCDGLSGLSGEDVCDGIPHCEDGTDEPESCEHFECDDGGIIPIQYWCDGVFADCLDGSDEVGCAPFMCPE